MKNILNLTLAISLVLVANCAFADTTTQTNKAGQILDDMSLQTELAAEDAVENIKAGSKKAGKFVKEKSIIVGEKTVKHTKSGLNKAKKATVRGANKVSNVTAKGMKKAAKKMQNSAEKTIEKTDKVLSETTPKCNCNCECNCENCNCNKKED